MIDSNTTVRTHIVRRVRRGLLRSRHPRRGALPRLPTALGVSGFVAPPYYAYIVTCASLNVYIDGVCVG
jgi:hypothetical protein